MADRYQISEESAASTARVTSFLLLVQEFSVHGSIMEIHSGLFYDELLELIVEYTPDISISLECHTVKFSVLRNRVGYSKSFHIFLWGTWVSNHKLHQQTIACLKRICLNNSITRGFIYLGISMRSQAETSLRIYRFLT
jgi:hypothetical protein